MARSAPVAPLEYLEPRVVLSGSAPLAPAAAPPIDTALRRYRIEAYSQQLSSTPAPSTSNTHHPDAQRFFALYKPRFTEPPAARDTTPAPSLAPDAPAAPAAVGVVTITEATMGSILRLTIRGSELPDVIGLKQFGATVVVTANGQVQQVNGAFGEIALYGGGGNDTLTVDASVTASALLYPGDGDDTVLAGTAAKTYIVAIGGGKDTLSGNGTSTSFWGDAADVITAGSGEPPTGNVHRVTAFYQPWTNDPQAPDYVPLTLDGRDLKDPTDSGVTVRVSDRSLWGAGPGPGDVNQGQVADCYFLSPLQSFAVSMPDRLREMAVDLGDGTFAVQFKRNGGTSFVRVDADLSAAPWGGLYRNRPAENGPIWASIMEKAYAFFRTAANTFASLAWGWTGSVYSDLGVANTTFSTSGDLSTLFAKLTTALAAGKAVDIISRSTVQAGAPVIRSHAYSVLGTSVDANGVRWVTLRNPWGLDGAGVDDNAWDGLVRVTITQLQENFSAGSIST